MVLTDTGLAKVFQRIKSFVIAQLNSKASAIHTHTVSDVSDLSTNYVTTDTTQTIDGTKKFTNTVTIEKSGGDTELLVKNTAVDTTSITTNAMDDIRFVDQNDNITGGLRLSYETNGSISTTMYARSYSQDGLTYANKVFTITSNIQTGISNSKLSTDFVPDTNNIYNLGSSTAQWNNAYIKSLTINGVACGDILTHNASEFVNVSSNQTIGGLKTWTSYQTISGTNLNNEFSSNARTCMYLVSNRDTIGKSGIYVTKFRQNRAQGSMGGNDNVILTMDVLENEVRTNDLLRFTAHNWINDVPTEMYLEPASKASNIQSFLGSSSRPWGNTTTNAINDINPGALSLPSMNFISLDTTSFDVTSSTIGAFTPTVDGWAILSISQKNKHFGIWILNGGYRATFHSVHNDTNYAIFALIPVRANATMTIYCSPDDIDSTRKVDWLRLFPCQGNV